MARPLEHVLFLLFDLCLVLRRSGVVRRSGERGGRDLLLAAAFLDVDHEIGLVLVDHRVASGQKTPHDLVTNLGLYFAGLWRYRIAVRWLRCRGDRECLVSFEMCGRRLNGMDVDRRLAAHRAKNRREQRGAETG